MAALREAHPYEEVAFDVVELESTEDLSTACGLGRIGDLPEPMRLADFVQRVADRLPVTERGVRAAGDPERMVQRVAVSSGAGDSHLAAAKALGADVVVHSTTKYLGGHSDVVGGVVVCNDAELDEKIQFLQGGAGAIPSPFDAFLTIRGLKTLNLRMDRHCANAQAVAELLDSHPKVASVLYPGLAGHPGHEVAARQMRGFGGMVSVRFHDEDAARAFCLNTTLIYLAESLGGVESLLEHPASMTHQSVEGSQLAVPRDLVRISVGIEDVDDLLADIRAALEAVS